MKPAPQSELFKLRGLFNQIIKEMNGRLTADEAVVKFDRAMTAKYLQIFTDNIEDPKHCLIVSHMPGMVDSGFICAVIMMYSSPQHRNQTSLDEMHNLVDNYAREHSCEAILGSAWKYKGARGIDSMWLSKGYELQETTYVKIL